MYCCVTVQSEKRQQPKLTAHRKMMITMVIPAAKIRVRTRRSESMCSASHKMAVKRMMTKAMVTARILCRAKCCGLPDNLPIRPERSKQLQNHSSAVATKGFPLSAIPPSPHPGSSTLQTS